MRPTFSIVIPAYNEGSQLLATITAVEASLHEDSDVEIIVVDDCSTDGSGQEAGRLIQDMRRKGRAIGVPRTPGRSGTERAKNFGLQLATAPIAVVLDAHAFPAQGALERLIAPMLEDPELVVAGPTIVTLPAPKAAEKLSGVWPLFNPIDLEPERLAELTDRDELSFGLGLRLQDPSMLFKWAPPRYMPGVRRVQAVVTGAMALRIDRWGQWGSSPIGPPWLLDEGMAYPYGIDGEISLRAWRLGFRVGLVPEAVVGIVFKQVQSYGVARITTMFNALRMAWLYMSPEVLDTVLAHYRTVVGFEWVMAQLMLDSDTAERRKLLDQMGPTEMEHLTPVLQEFGGLDVAVGDARSLMRRPPGGAQ